LTQIATAAVGSTPATSQAFDHNLMGRVVNQTESIGSSTYQMSYSYDLGGRLTSETYPSGRVVNDAYDEAARLQSVTDATNRTYDSGFTYDPRRAVTAENFGNGATRTVSYNNRLQTSQVKLMAGGVEQQRYDYWYGQIDQASGNVDQTKHRTGRTHGRLNRRR
jgi:YD repeat-containing protein